MRRSVAALLGVGSLLVAARAAHAQDERSLSPSTPPDSRADLGVQRPYWSAGPPRVFAAVIFENAGIAGKTELDFGYGRPHYMWAGLQVDSAFSLRGIYAFTGVRAAAPWGSVRFGPRFWTALSQRLVEKEDSISRRALEIHDGPRSRYVSLDAEASFAIPLPVGTIGALVSAYALFGVPDDYYVFEDALRVVVEPPFVGRLRLSYLVGIGNPATLRVGGLAEAIYNPGREMVNVRLGPAVAVSLTHHLEALASVALSVYNPDDLGAAGADLGQIGLRYRWATGDLWPEFP